jgi:hypothetical protein
MKQLNTSHNKISFEGILQPIVDLLAKTSRKEGVLTGQEVISPRKEIQTIVAIDSSNDIHLLISPALEEDERFSKLNLKGLKVINREWAVAGRTTQNYLDISCTTGSMPSFRRPFLRFAEDVLFEISMKGVTAADAIYNTGMRWKKFWSVGSLTEVTSEWLHGLFGELVFLHELIVRYGPSSIQCWTGSSGTDHDFQNGHDLAVEVKTSTKMPLRIHCNIRQLDSDIFKKLFVVCYHLTSSEKGLALPQIVRMIEEEVDKDSKLLDMFYEKLVAAGYSRELEQIYSEKSFIYSSEIVYRIDNSFPRIVEKSFETPPDHRISDIRYSLQLTGLKELTLDSITGDLADLVK